MNCLFANLLFTNATSDSIPLLILIVFHKVRHPLLLRFTSPLCHPPFPLPCPMSNSSPFPPPPSPLVLPS